MIVVTIVVTKMGHRARFITLLVVSSNYNSSIESLSGIFIHVTAAHKLSQAVCVCVCVCCVCVWVVCVGCGGCGACVVCLCVFVCLSAFVCVCMCLSALVREVEL